ncbi:MAG: hypothetical protein EWV75_20550 [Microcystis wesenbergii Mw_QC_S_20081001_S30D]|jgi:hypothetical protein|uniref:DUF4347 domain-containing protein n=1 Tax=Microcystis wesenbergii Mw_QC_S_20081001_S30D TaxID=2486245 RepID=A0A552J9N4_9CHRO|nr:MAG: hypothetical protein EWV75_20550 [Microcystis wesenbergii Mw_QC_S_20081001_S30D]
MSKLFLYDPDSVTKDTLIIMGRKGYNCTELTEDSQFFWNTMNSLNNHSTFALLSHGDGNGPLPVRGTSGDDINLDDFSQVVSNKDLKLYLLSCHTGNDPCGTRLLDAGITFVAPKGAAEFRTAGTDTVTVMSKDGDTFPGWCGPLSPDRASKAIYLP